MNIFKMKMWSEVVAIMVLTVFVYGINIRDQAHEHSKCLRGCRDPKPKDHEDGYLKKFPNCIGNCNKRFSHNIPNKEKEVREYRERDMTGNEHYSEDIEGYRDDTRWDIKPPYEE